MESLSVAQVAAALGLPFIAVRVIVDTAADVLPRAVLAASRGGQLERLAACSADSRERPRSSAALIRLAQRYRAATRSLAAVARAAASAPQVSGSPRRMKALVTGATGFVGAAVARALLRAGWQVRVLVRAGLGPQQSAAARGRGRRGRSRRRGLARARARGLRRHCFTSRRTIGWARAIPAPLYRTNVDGTRNILSAARNAGGRANRLHQQRRDHRHTGGRRAGRGDAPRWP